MDRAFRKAWFEHFQVGHRELRRLTDDLLELMDPTSDVRLISIIGATGVGKSTVASVLPDLLREHYSDQVGPDECPVVYVTAPANGERSFSWKMLYRRILEASHEPGVDFKRLTTIKDGRLYGERSDGKSVAALREQVERMIRHRNVRALVIDEVFHLMRFHDTNYPAIMDTLKSLADIGSTKLIFIGTFDIADLVTDYAQLVRRSEILHFRRYELRTKPGKKPNADEQEYINQLQKFEANWPSRFVPKLVDAWRQFMDSSLGTLGLTKHSLNQLVVQQLAHPDEAITQDMVAKAFKSQRNLSGMREETESGELKLHGRCYGDAVVAPEWLDLVCNAGAPKATGASSTEVTRHG